MKKRVCVITGSRADYGLLRLIMQGIKKSPNLNLQVIATGMHLSEDYGNTYKEIESDGFDIDRKVPIITRSETEIDVIKSMGEGIKELAVALDDLKPDLAVILGDRYEIMAAAQALVVMQIPAVHLCGGDAGSGTYDNIFRNCISLMSVQHCVTHERAKQNLLSLGICEESIHNVGATCVDGIQEMDLLNLSELCEELDIVLLGQLVVVTFHPLTRGLNTSVQEFQEILMALNKLKSVCEITIVFTASNADNGGGDINQMINSFVENHDASYWIKSLGQFRYLSLIKNALMVVGNSSSGIYEAPYLDTSTINVGRRQNGRLAPESVIQSEARCDDIFDAMCEVISDGFTPCKMLYGNGGASKEVVKIINEYLDKITTK